MRKLLTILFLFPALCFSQTTYRIQPSIIPGASGEEQTKSEPDASEQDTTENYYVSKTGTGDTLTTIAEVNALSLEPGDSVFFKCGDTWRETLTIPSSGTAGNYITFTSYGSGAKPQILGSELTTGFVNVTGNIWGATNDLDDPYDIGSLDMEIWFEETDNSITWGDTKKTWTADFSNLVDEYDWTWHNDTIYVYAATDPDSRYSSVEIPQRPTIIDINEKEYIEINGFELAYAVDGVGGRPEPMVEKNGFIFGYNTVHHMGTKNGAGYGVTDIVWNNSLYYKDTIYEMGRRGISLGHYGANNVSNIVIDGCVFHDGYHTTGIDLQLNSSGDMDSVIIRNCLFYDSENITLGSYPETNYISCDAAGELSGFYFYNNVVKYPAEHGIVLQEVNDAYFYNNTFYGVNKNVTWVTFFNMGVDTADIVNNIFYGDTISGIIYPICLQTVPDYDNVYADYNLYYGEDDDWRLVRDLSPSANYYESTIAALRTNWLWEVNSPNPADPTFTDKLNGNFHLQTGSPAIDNGLSVPWITTDKEGIARDGAPNIGAFETTEDP
jgi:hypothetical protein